MSKPIDSMARSVDMYAHGVMRNILYACISKKI